MKWFVLLLVDTAIQPSELYGRVCSRHSAVIETESLIIIN